jgi:hypothetical protein
MKELITSIAIWLSVTSVLLVAVPGVSAEPGDRVVTAEAPIVNGNAVVAKQRAMVDAFRQATERAFTELLKESGAEGQPLAGGLMKVKASLASRGQRFVRSYRVLEQDESNGRLRLQIDADVDTALLRREMERARGGTGEPEIAAAQPAGPSVVVGGELPDESKAAVLNALASAGVRAKSIAVRDEAPLVAAAAPQAGQGLWLAGTVFAEGTIRGSSRRSVRCELHARVLPTVAGSRGALLDQKFPERGFAGDETAARLACWQRAGQDLARQMTTLQRPIPASSRFVTLDLQVVEPSALLTLVQVLKRLGAVSAAEVRRVSVRQAEIRVFTRMSAREVQNALIRDIGTRLVVTEVKPPTDRLSLQVRQSQTDEPQPAAGAEPPANKP